jgi:hypothetical protein
VEAWTNDGVRTSARRVPPAHAEWSPPYRSDPITVLEAQAETRVRELLPIRYDRMAVSPFAFYRGAAAIMAMDLDPAPVTGLRVQACGDAHVANFGKFATPERSLVFDINDFDETVPGPWEWDVKRLAGSLHVVVSIDSRRTRRDRDRRTAIGSTWPRRYSRRSTSVRAHAHQGRHRTLPAEVPTGSGTRRQEALQFTGARSLTASDGDAIRFVEDPPLTVHLSATMHDMDDVAAMVDSYLQSLSHEIWICSTGTASSTSSRSSGSAAWEPVLDLPVRRSGTRAATG